MVRVLVFLLLCLLVPASSAASQILLLKLAQKTTAELRLKLGAQLLSGSLHQVERLGAHGAFGTLTEDVATITSVAQALPMICISVSTLIGCLFYIALISHSIIISLIGGIAFGIGMYRFQAGKADRYLKRAREQYDRMCEHFSALMHGNKELKLHRGRRTSFAQSLQNCINDLRSLNLKANSIYITATQMGEMIFVGMIGIFLFVPVLSGPSRMSCLLAVFMIKAPVIGLANFLPVIARARVSLERIQRLQEGLSADASESSTQLSSFQRRYRQLELNAVKYTYRREGETPFVLGPLDLTFLAGELVFIAGGNGSGKTTLAKIVAGLYPPEDGIMKLDGVPITAANRDDYRQHFSAVWSDCYVFRDMFGLEGDDVEANARKLLDSFRLPRVQVEDRKFSTTALSQGQRKRLALLTACLEDRPFFVLDEWAADQDPAFRELFYRVFLPDLKTKGKTILVISHDERYYEIADRVIKLDEGNIVCVTPGAFQATAISSAPALNGTPVWL
jgi:putative ATP-binding cassette transporter